MPQGGCAAGVQAPPTDEAVMLVRNLFCTSAVLGVLAFALGGAGSHTGHSNETVEGQPALDPNPRQDEQDGTRFSLLSEPLAPAPSANAPSAAQNGCQPTSDPCGTEIGVKWYCDVAYAPEPAGVRVMDIYLPTTVTPTRTILWIHGKQWSAGSKSDHADVLKELARLGNAVASMDYTLATDAQPSFPRCIQDVLQAITYLRGDLGAEYCLPPCIVVVGNSAGGHLAAMATTGWDVDYFNPANSTGTPCYVSGLMLAEKEARFRPDLVVTISATPGLYALGVNGYNYHDDCQDTPVSGPPIDSCLECPGVDPHVDYPAGYVKFDPSKDPPERLVGIDWTATSGFLNCGTFWIQSNIFRRASAGTWISSNDPPYHGFSALCDNLAFNVNPATQQDSFAVTLNATTGTATYTVITDCAGCRHALSILGNDAVAIAGVIDSKINDLFLAHPGLCGGR